MTIDEAIAHAREKAEQNRNRALHFNTVKCIKCAEEHDQLADWLTHLKEYQQLEEQGRLLKLPCKVGDIVYVNGVLGCGVAEKYKVIKVNYYSTLGTRRNEFYIEALLNDDPRNSIAFYDKELGKTVFLTKKEAETKLEEIMSGEDV